MIIHEVETGLDRSSDDEAQELAQAVEGLYYSCGKSSELHLARTDLLVFAGDERISREGKLRLAGALTIKLQKSGFNSLPYTSDDNQMCASIGSLVVAHGNPAIIKELVQEAELQVANKFYCKALRANLEAPQTRRVLVEDLEYQERMDCLYKTLGEAAV